MVVSVNPSRPLLAAPADGTRDAGASRTLRGPLHPVAAARAGLRGTKPKI